MQPGEIKSILDSLCAVAEAETMAHFRQAPAVENKDEAGFDPVTLADRGAEAAIHEWLARHYPHHGILGEEQDSVNPDAEYCWIVDPVDGTRAFICGLPSWGTLIGLFHNGKPVAGVMHQPHTREKFWTAGNGSWLETGEGQARLSTSLVTRVSAAKVMTTTPDLFRDAEADAWQRIARRSRLVRFGFDCYAYAMVAAGHVDLVIETGLKIYDIAALIPLIENAGGMVRSWDGGEATGDGRIIAAANQGLLEEAMELLAAAD